MDLGGISDRRGERVVDGPVALEITEGDQGDVGGAFGLERLGTVDLAGRAIQARLDRTGHHHMTGDVASKDEITERDQRMLGLGESGGHGQLLRRGFTLGEGTFESIPRCPQWAM